jgi:hypothetical protein
VNLDALREHLIEMDEVTLRANAAVKRIDSGIMVVVTGSGAFWRLATAEGAKNR